MATQDDFVKTALRLPRSLHSEIQAAAKASGRSMNAELIGRLQASVDAQSAAVLMERLRASEDALLETARKERDQLASVVARFRAVLEGIERALASAEPSSEVANAQRDLEVIRAVIATVNGHS